MEEAEKLYRWILSEYEKYKQGIITEEEYREKLKDYEEKIASMQKEQVDDKLLEKIEEESGVSKTTSVVGLRNLILKELKKTD